MVNTKHYFAISILLVLLVAYGTFYLSNNDEKEVVDPIGGIERPYYFRIELAQWSIKVIDLNKIEDSMLEGSSRSEAFAQATYTDYLGKLEKGSQVFLQIYSIDVPHGFSMSELNIHITIIEKTEDIDSTIPYFHDFILPSSDSSITAYCQIDCGVGHSEMKIRYEVGDGLPQYGKLYFNGFLLINATLTLLFVYLIFGANIKKKYMSNPTT